MTDDEGVAKERRNLARIKELLGCPAEQGGLVSDTLLAVVERLAKLEELLGGVLKGMAALELRLQELEAIHPRWTDMPR
jgi:hypothetical protein